MRGNRLTHGSPPANLTKEVKDLYYENFKTPKKEIKEDARTWKDPSTVLMD